MEKASDKIGIIQKRVLIQAEAGIVYDALTESRDLIHWFCDRCTSDPRPGGELRAFWRAGKNGQRGRGVYVRIEPGSYVELRWVDDGTGAVEVDEASHVLSYTIRLRRDSTELLMRDEDARALLDGDAAAVFNEGWTSSLLLLKDYCERKQRSARRRPDNVR